MSGKSKESKSSTSPVSRLQDVIGERGEKIFELAITDFRQFKGPLFKPAFLGDKWPTIDFYIELLGVPPTSPFFFVQVKSTSAPLLKESKVIKISAPKEGCELLFKVPGPTYLVGVHEPTKKAYILSVHQPPKKGIFKIPLTHELTPGNLKILYEEVRAFWENHPHKPLRSHFI